ncbi:GPP34 family phosphoprotein [Williamsia sp. CHRR-6]|uniref:GOLPH3/VPS74 family protein n=1 Tax=Williamsia sp. CHRR-6 TaxID=2835871 RepID=UPI001BDA7C35|nr:GPP34 family phosphoprotein [Williamsia sp. CHRR-6]MBT0566464.1 GPP34 family phosphoprotein [Williamsia sp. CHRR-6]
MNRPPPTGDLGLAEQFIVLTIDPVRQQPYIGDIHLPLPIACCLMLDLAIRQRIWIDHRESGGFFHRGVIRVADPSPTGNVHLDMVIATMMGSPPKPAHSWIRRIDSYGPRVLADTRAHALAAGHLVPGVSRQLGFTRPGWSVPPGSPIHHLAATVDRALAGGPQFASTTALIAMFTEFGLLRLRFPRALRPVSSTRFHLFPALEEMATQVMSVLRSDSVLIRRLHNISD